MDAGKRTCVRLLAARAQTRPAPNQAAQFVPHLIGCLQRFSAADLFGTQSSCIPDSRPCGRRLSPPGATRLAPNITRWRATEGLRVRPGPRPRGGVHDRRAGVEGSLRRRAPRARARGGPESLNARTPACPGFARSMAWRERPNAARERSACGSSGAFPVPSRRRQRRRSAVSAPWRAACQGSAGTARLPRPGGARDRAQVR